MQVGTPVILLSVLLLSGCVAQPATPGSQTTVSEPANLTETETATQHATATPSAVVERIDSELIGLRDAANKSEYARIHGLTVRNNAVSVVAVLRAGTEPPSSVGEIEIVHNNTAVMMIPIDRLNALAKHQNVTYVRAPRQPVTSS
jgi:hypothetical protein